MEFETHHAYIVFDVVIAICPVLFLCPWPGDMPVALMFDGPSMGGFVCPATIPSAQLWKMGQVSAKDEVLFKPMTLGAPPALFPDTADMWPKIQVYVKSASVCKV